MSSSLRLQALSLLGAVPRCAFRRNLQGFMAAAEDCQATQQRVLQELISLNDSSRFSREHGLGSIRNVDEFRRRMPIVDFEYFRSYIEDLKQGDFQSLLGHKNRLLMFTLSSGTTSESKFIPITERFLANYRRGWQNWGIRAFDDHPQLKTQKILQLTSNHDRFRTAGDTPCGNISGLVVSMQNAIIRQMYSVPGEVARVSDSLAKSYLTLRLAIVDRDIGLITTANPSTLIQLAKLADHWSEELIRDVHDGTCSSDFDVPEEVLRRLRSRIRRPSPARAKELEQVRDRVGRFFPRDFWPDARLLAVWTGGSSCAYLHLLKEYFGEIPIRDHGLSASEGRMTIPFSDGQSGGVLDVTTHFFEFIPEREHGGENPTVLEAHELQEGETYFILLTTSSGLYRYDIRDVVRCTGFQGSTPILEFLHKGAHISNITGEKISESQVASAVSRSVQQLQIALEHFTVAPVWGEPPEYQLLVEERDVGSPTLRARLAGHVDSSLQSLNCEYREKRDTGRLAPLSCVPLSDGAWKHFIGARISGLGGSLEQYKHPCLVPDLNFKSSTMKQFVLENANRDA